MRGDLLDLWESYVFIGFFTIFIRNGLILSNDRVLYVLTEFSFDVFDDTSSPNANNAFLPQKT